MGTHSFSLRIQHMLLATRIALLQGTMGTHSFQLWVPHESSPSLAEWLPIEQEEWCRKSPEMCWLLRLKP